MVFSIAVYHPSSLTLEAAFETHAKIPVTVMHSWALKEAVHACLVFRCCGWLPVIRFKHRVSGTEHVDENHVFFV